MKPIARAFNAIGGALMARSGRIGILVTTGRRSGTPRKAPLGFLLRDDGSIVVAAGGTARAWVVNLQANPLATFRIKGVGKRYRARLLEGDERTALLGAFKKQQGGFGERAAWAEVFLLEPAGSSPVDVAGSAGTSADPSAGTPIAGGTSPGADAGGAARVPAGRHPAVEAPTPAGPAACTHGSHR